MTETTALIVLVSITVFVLVSITLLCMASMRDSTDRMQDIIGDWPNVKGASDE